MEKYIHMYPGETTPTFRYKWLKGDSTKNNFQSLTLQLLEIFFTGYQLFTLVTQILMLVTKSESSWASWPQDFFLKVEPWFCNLCEKQTIKMISTQQLSLICHENAAQQHSANRRNLKMLAFQFCLDRKHFENRADFPAQVFFNHKTKMTVHCCICTVWTKTFDVFMEWNIQFQISLW